MQAVNKTPTPAPRRTAPWRLHRPWAEAAAGAAAGAAAARARPRPALAPSTAGSVMPPKVQDVLKRYYSESPPAHA